MKKYTIKLRYNTECADKRLFWRVLINGVEHLAAHVYIKIPVETTADFLADKGVIKHHISCASDHINWEGDALTIS